MELGYQRPQAQTEERIHTTQLEDLMTIKQSRPSEQGMQVM